MILSLVKSKRTQIINNLNIILCIFQYVAKHFQTERIIDIDMKDMFNVRASFC